MGHGLIPFRRSKKHGYKATAQSNLKSEAVMFSDCARQRNFRRFFFNSAAYCSIRAGIFRIHSGNLLEC